MKQLVVVFFSFLVFECFYFTNSAAVNPVFDILISFRKSWIGGLFCVSRAQKKIRVNPIIFAPVT